MLKQVVEHIVQQLSLLFQGNVATWQRGEGWSKAAEKNCRQGMQGYCMMMEGIGIHGMRVTCGMWEALGTTT